MLVNVFALEFPSIDEIVKFPPLFGDGTIFAFNKVALISVLAAGLTLLVFFLAGNKRALVPTGVQNLAESSVDFIREGIILQTMGPDGMAWQMFLTSLFFFVFFSNIFEIIPVFQMPATARMATPMFLALLSWVLFIGTGIVKQGPKYFKEALFPPGVPAALYILVTPIELISTFLVRPFSLAVRLFANMLAGHILLVTFAVLSTALIEASGVLKAVFVLPAVMLVLLTGFEVLVAVLQAYIFTILTAVYIGGAMHPEH